MAARDRHSADSALVLALAAGLTTDEAAQRAHVSASTVARRKRDPAFVAQVDAARRELWTQALGQAADACTDAVACLRDLLGDRVSMARLGAARALLEIVAAGIKTVELEQRLAEVEAQLSQMRGGLHRVV